MHRDRYICGRVNRRFCIMLHATVWCYIECSRVSAFDARLVGIHHFNQLNDSTYRIVMVGVFNAN